MVAACRNRKQLVSSYTGEVREGDLRDPDYLDRVLTGIDIICHAAGWSSFEDSGDTCNKAYLEPTLDLINHAIEWRVSRFVNLSSLFVARSGQRNLSAASGQPRAYWPMINCLIAVEDYLRNYHDSRCQFINLRLGIYSGRRLNMGLLPLLLSRDSYSSLPYITGPMGHLPLVDGRDIGQAFSRAALAPLEANYSCINITGPEVPSHSDVMSFIQQQCQSAPMSWGLPASLASPLLWFQGKLRQHNQHTLMTTAMIDMLKSPDISLNDARQQLGYDPEISWQATLLETLEIYKNQSLNEKISESYHNLNLN